MLICPYLNSAGLLISSLAKLLLYSIFISGWDNKEHTMVYSCQFLTHTTVEGVFLSASHHCFDTVLVYFCASATQCFVLSCISEPVLVYQLACACTCFICGPLRVHKEYGRSCKRALAYSFPCVSVIQC